MSFNEGISLDTSRIEGGGGGGGGGSMVIGGGIGGLILTLILLFLGINPGSLPGGGGITQDGSVSTNQQDTTSFAHCKSGADADKYVDCRIIATVNSADTFWADQFQKIGRSYTPPHTVIYSGATQSACGTASNQVGPFYCPLDQKIYIDASFYDILQQKFRSSTGPLAQEYVVAHEYGHHIENLFGILDRAQQDQSTGPNSAGVRVELMADCFGGVWAKHATTTPDTDTGVPFLKGITQQDLLDALSAAKAVGDDSIQSMTTGQVNPEMWTHGSSEARQRWFLQGFKSGDFQQCDTFAVPTVE